MMEILFERIASILASSAGGVKARHLPVASGAVARLRKSRAKQVSEVRFPERPPQAPFPR